LPSDSTEAPIKWLRSLLCAHFIGTPVKPEFCAKLLEVIKSSVLIINLISFLK